MSEPPSEPEPTEPGRSIARPQVPPADRRSSIGALVLGGLLVLAGLGWLLETTDAVEVPWATLLPVALILVGVALLAAARRERPRGLIAAGVMLTVLSAAFSVGGAGVGGVGERTYRPATVAALEETPDLGIGELGLDLRGLARSAVGRAEDEIEVRLGIGELTVVLPADLPVEIAASAGIGDVHLPGGSDSGFGAEATFGDFQQGGDRLRLNLSVGIGSITVQR